MDNVVSSDGHWREDHGGYSAKLPTLVACRLTLHRCHRPTSEQRAEYTRELRWTRVRMAGVTEAPRRWTALALRVGIRFDRTQGSRVG